MILEVAILNVREGQADAFEAASKISQVFFCKLIRGIPT